MNDSINLCDQDIPQWYEMGLSNGKTGIPRIFILIHESVIDDWGSTQLGTASLAVVESANYIGIGPETFQPKLEKDFGFNGAIKRTRKIGKFVEFSFDVPQIFLDTGVKCSVCMGTKECEGSACPRCRGTGKRFKRNDPEVCAVAASLSILLSCLEHPPKKNTGAYPQLLTVNTAVVGHCALHGVISPFCASRIGLCFRETGFSRAPDFMKHVYTYVMGGYIAAEESFLATWDPDSFTLGCPGETTSIFREPWSHGQHGPGYKFTSHNVDTFPQQFALLAGLAALAADIRNLKP